MQRYDWDRLNKLQVGAYAEYFVKMELTMYGFQVYATEVDDRGVDFVARYESGPFIEVQVKSLRSMGYVFVQKEKFALREHLYLALGILRQERPPALYLIPATAWKETNALFVSRDYKGLKSRPEWGLNVSKKNLPWLEHHRFDVTVETMVGEAANQANSADARTSRG